MSENRLISIIMPALNAGSTIAEAIHSVLLQSHGRWELIIVDNGSSDNTTEVALSFEDERIQLLHQADRGVSRARNTGLDHASGDYVCFLDADDVLPSESLSARSAILDSNDEVWFADGAVRNLDSGEEIYRPTFEGMPLEELCRMTSSCFFGNTWMIRMPVSTRFRTELSHCEDLMFYLEQADNGKFSFSEQPVLFYRRVQGSAMSDLEGLEAGYKTCFAIMQGDKKLSPFAMVFAKKARSIMWKSYLKLGRPLKAVRLWLQFFS